MNPIAQERDMRVELEKVTEQFQGNTVNDRILHSHGHCLQCDQSLKEKNDTHARIGLMLFVHLKERKELVPYPLCYQCGLGLIKLSKEHQQYTRKQFEKKIRYLLGYTNREVYLPQSHTN